MAQGQGLDLAIQQAWHNEEDYFLGVDHVAISARWQEIADQHAGLAVRLAGHGEPEMSKAAGHIAAHAQLMSYIHSELAVLSSWDDGQELVDMAAELLKSSSPAWETLEDLRALTQSKGAGSCAKKENEA